MLVTSFLRYFSPRNDSVVPDIFQFHTIIKTMIVDFQERLIPIESYGSPRRDLRLQPSPITNNEEKIIVFDDFSARSLRARTPKREETPSKSPKSFKSNKSDKSFSPPQSPRSMLNIAGSASAQRSFSPPRPILNIAGSASVQSSFSPPRPMLNMAGYASVQSTSARVHKFTDLCTNALTASPSSTPRYEYVIEIDREIPKMEQGNQFKLILVRDKNQRIRRNSNASDLFDLIGPPASFFDLQPGPSSNAEKLPTPFYDSVELRLRQKTGLSFLPDEIALPRHNTASLRKLLKELKLSLRTGKKEKKTQTSKTRKKFRGIEKISNRK